MKRSLYLVVLCFLFITQGIASDNKIEFTEFDLDNGLHVILHQDNSTPIYSAFSGLLMGITVSLEFSKSLTG